MRLLVIRKFSATFLLTLFLFLCGSGVGYAEKWALLIGIDQYADINRINPLGAAAADAKALASTLRDVAGFDADHIQLLVSDGEVKPTRPNILNALGRLVKSAQPGDTVFVLYSGHGVEVKGIPYLLPFDTTAFDEESLADSALEVSRFRQRLGQIKTKALILAFDMCRSDPQKSGKDVAVSDNTMTSSLTRGLDFKASSTVNGAKAAANAAVTITLFSCSPNERSYEWAEKGRGYFSYFLEQGLRGKAADQDGVVTGRSLANYVGQQVRSAVERTERRQQTPYPSLDGNGVESFILANTASRSESPGTVATVLPKKLNTRAQLTVEANVPEAVVAVDGVTVPGNTYAANLLDEPQKEVEVTITAPGYETLVMTVTLRRGKTEPLKVTLNSVPVPERVTANPVPSAAKVVVAALTPDFFLTEARNVSRDLTGVQKANALAVIARAQAATGDTQGATLTAEESNRTSNQGRDSLRGIGPYSSERAMILAAIAKAQIALGDISQAKNTLVEARNAAKIIDNIDGRPNAFAEIALMQALAGDNDAAKESIADAKAAWRRRVMRHAQHCGVLANIARSQFACGDIAGARKTISAAQTLVRTLSAEWENSGPLSGIAQAQAACGDIAGAKATASQVFNVYRKSEALCAISKAEAMRGGLAAAIATAQPIVDDSRRSEAMVAIAVQQAKNGDISAAKATASGISPAYRKAEALAGIAEMMAKIRK